LRTRLGTVRGWRRQKRPEGINTSQARRRAGCRRPNTIGAPSLVLSPGAYTITACQQVRVSYARSDGSVRGPEGISTPVKQTVQRNNSAMWRRIKLGFLNYECLPVWVKNTWKTTTIDRNYAVRLQLLTKIFLCCALPQLPNLLPTQPKPDLILSANSVG
jgi:hypothetical protein